jgi:outer membrane protein assembly factor BamB
MFGRRLLQLGLVVGLVASAAGCWWQPNADGANTRWNPWERRITPANVASLRPVWSREMASGTASHPLIAGGRVYVSRFDYLDPEAGIVALDLGTGATLWDRTISPPGASPAYPMDPGAFVNGELWTGWSGGAGDPCSGTMRIDPAGNVVPTTSPGPPVPIVGPLHSGRYVVQVTFASCPSPTSPFPPQVLTVSDAATGATVWSAQGSNFSPTIYAAGGGLIVTSGGAYPLAGCGAPTCSPLWRPAVPGNKPIVIGPGRDVFVQRPGIGVPTGEIVALSTATGQVTWRAPYQGFDAEIAVDDDHLYVSEGNGARLLAFDVDGCGTAVCAPRWSAVGGAGAPIVGGDVVYVQGPDDTIKAYDADGCGLAVCPALASLAPPPDETAMAVGEGHLLVVSGTGEPGRYRLTAFKPTAPA